MAPHADWAPVPAPGVTPRVLDDVTVLEDRDGAPLLRLNDTALAIWQLCDGRTTVEEMVGAVTPLFDVDQAQARRDVSAALDDLRGAGVLL